MSRETGWYRIKFNGEWIFSLWWHHNSSVYSWEISGELFGDNDLDKPPCVEDKNLTPVNPVPADEVNICAALEIIDEFRIPLANRRLDRDELSPDDHILLSKLDAVTDLLLEIETRVVKEGEHG